MNLVDLVRSGKRNLWVFLWSPRVFLGIAMPLVMFFSLVVGYVTYPLGPNAKMVVVVLSLFVGYFLDVWRRETLSMSRTLPLVIDQLVEDEEDPDERVRLLGVFREWLLANHLVGPKVSPWIWNCVSRHCFALTWVHIDRLLKLSKIKPLEGPWEKVEGSLPINELVEFLSHQTRLAIPVMVYTDFGFCNVFFFSILVGLPMSAGLALHDPISVDQTAGMLGVLGWW